MSIRRAQRQDEPASDEAPTGARILAIDDDPPAHQLYKRALKNEGYEVVSALNGAEGMEQATGGGFDLILLDYKLPDTDGITLLNRLQSVAVDTPVIMVTSHGSTQRAVQAIRSGAHDFVEKPFGIEGLRVSVGNALQFGRLRRREAFLRERVFQDRYLQEDGARPSAFDDLPPELARVLQRAAPARSTLLLTGETGVGKEHVAALIHQESPRRNAAFVAVNCAAIPAEIAESELFGHEKGAFTGADSARAGKFEVADGGTLFLDEIGELPPTLQPKLLRALESGEVTRVGARSARRLDVRILAATNRDLEAEVEAGRFREDLYFRLNVLRLRIPPLRERPDMIQPLAEKFLRRMEAELGRRFDGFTDEARQMLAKHPFPGNVRELSNAVERAALLEDDARITAGSLALGTRLQREGQTAEASMEFREARDAFERRYFRALMERTGGNVSEAARRAGLHRNSLRAHLVRLGLVEED